ncbi:carbon-nitrogen hydrolase [Streptomyces sp. 110]|uniref:Carbon-nitrogen hydrolase n=1 Tax=Streptomyces endocoffeicus TaxID=2898945 RepID=A0ABS1Q609_9ACTN|nr:nitrilase-related carbon-nitrogen hydrolase [Streptomyces endocoffeicus]MBL1119769.1 carbon-nitrogen hydrolase [Streptomyces endocoffeicus]
MSAHTGAARELRVVLAQLTPHPADVVANLARLETLVGEHPRAELMVFPELFLTGYNLDAVHELALDPQGDVVVQVRTLARHWRTAIIVGFAEIHGDKVANSLACIDSDGSMTGVYRKAHLFGRERDHFTAGDRLPVVELAGIRVGPMICFDIEFPEPARTLALDGAQLLVSVAANMEPYEPDHHLASRARALDNRLPHIYVNRTGWESPFVFTGHSRIVAADGSVRLQLGADECVASSCVTIDAGTSEPTDYLNQLRPDLYGGQLRTASG